MGLWEDLVNASLRHSFFRATDRAVNKPSRKSGDADDAVIVTLIACKLSFCADISTLRPSSELIQLQLTVPAVFGVVTDAAWKMTGGPKRQQWKGLKCGKFRPFYSGYQTKISKIGQVGQLALTLRNPQVLTSGGYLSKKPLIL
uniref:Uncharacterized protein n=1 Tax=Ascaris lumbricoides TaxID=6252 RepID=A0A0M3I204_ASCLU